MVIVLVLVMSTIAYFIRTHRVRESCVSFLARSIAIFGALSLIQNALLQLLPSFRATPCHYTATVVDCFATTP